VFHLDDRRRFSNGVSEDGHSGKLFVILAKVAPSRNSYPTVNHDPMRGAAMNVAIEPGQVNEMGDHERSSEPRLAPDHVAFIEKAPFVFAMSGSPFAAPDVSPRGDAPGFVKVVDGRRLPLPDRAGNNRIDTIRNALQDPRVALVFVCLDENRALEVTGTAKILNDPALLAEFEIAGRRPRSVMEISVTSATLKPSPALDLSAFWSLEEGHEVKVPTLGEILAGQVGGMTKDEMEAMVASSYINKLY
jgi:uncharacterized protein